VHAFSVEVPSQASPERVWELLAATETWAEWGLFDESELEQAGASEPQGIGAVRRFRTGKRITRERVVAFKAPEHFGYELLSGLPIRDYRADVTLRRESADGTLIRWESRFRGKFPVPGALAKPKLEQFVRRTAEALARAAEQAY
jgi:Polyketide cyclase / dehydrase and lipid transport